MSARIVQVCQKLRAEFPVSRNRELRRGLSGKLRCVSGNCAVGISENLGYRLKRLNLGVFDAAAVFLIAERLGEEERGRVARLLAEGLRAPLAPPGIAQPVDRISLFDIPTGSVLRLMIDWIRQEDTRRNGLTWRAETGGV